MAGPAAVVDDGGSSWPGASMVVRTGTVGQVQSVLRDTVSQRVRYLVASYTSENGTSRRVAVPVDWVVEHRLGRAVLGVGRRDLDNLAEYTNPPLASRTALRGGGAAVLA